MKISYLILRRDLIIDLNFYLFRLYPYEFFKSIRKIAIRNSNYIPAV